VNQIILWFNMISFTGMIASAGLSYVVYTRSGAIWLRDYLWYAFSYAFWLLFATWVFFQQVYLAEPAPQLTLVFAWVRTAVSVAIAVWGPLFFLQAGGMARSRSVVRAVLAAAALLVVVILVFMIAQSSIMGRIVTLSFNIAFAVLSTFAYRGMRRGRGNRARPMLPLVLYSAVAYWILVVLSVLVPILWSGALAIHINAFASGGFLFGWAVVTMVVNLRWIGGRDDARDPVPAAFVTDHSISPREAEILRVLVTGRTSAEIGEQLFISQRTVEAHLYRIYRKCGVGNRVELLNRITSYRGT